MDSFQAFYMSEKKLYFLKKSVKTVNLITAMCTCICNLTLLEQP